jgi:hypothetical protein
VSTENADETRIPRLPKLDPNAPDRLDPTVYGQARDLILDCLDPAELVEWKLNPLKIGSEFVKHWFRSREQKEMVESHRNLRRMVSQLRDIENQIFKYAFDHMKPFHIEALRELDEFTQDKPGGVNFTQFLEARNFDFCGHSTREVLDRLRELGLVEISELHERKAGGWGSTPDIQWSFQTSNVRVTPWALWKPVLTVTGRQVVVLIDKAYPLALGLPVNLDS